MTAQSHHRILIASAAMALSTSHVTAFNHVWLPSRRPSIHHHRHPYSSPKSIATPSTRTAPSKPLSILGATMDRDATSSNSNSSDSSTLEGAEWYVKQPKDDPNVVVDIEAKREAFQRSLLAARIANDFKSGDVHVDSAGSMGDVSLSSSTATTTPISNTPFAILAAKLAKDVLSPLLDPTIAKNVPPPTIRGAALAGSFLSFLSLALFFGTWGISPFPFFESLAAAASAGLFFAYAAITEGTAGTAARTAGAWTQRAVDAAWETYREVEAGRKVDRAVRAMETIEKVSPSNQEELTPNDNDDDHVVENVLHEAQRAIRQAEEAKRALRDASLRKTEALVLASQKIDDVQKTKEELARRKREEEEKARRAEEELARKEREVQLAQEAERRRLEEWERIREKEWVEEQNRLAEERRAKRVEEEKRLIEEMRLAEQARIAEEMRLAEEAMAEAERRKEEEAARKREEERIAEETRIAAEKAEAARVMKEEQERMAAELRARAEEEARLRKLEEEKKRAAEEQEAARLAEFQRSAEEARIKEEAEQRRLEEEARIKKEKEEEERRRLEEERRLMEEEEEQRRLEEEMRIQKEKEEEERRRLEEEMRIQKEKEEEERRRLEEEARIQKEKEEEEQRRLEEVAAAAREAVRLAETEAAFMEDDDDEDGELIDDDDWEASVRLANELVGMPSSGLGNFSEDTDYDDDMDDLLQMELSELSPEEEDALGKAAREAVRKYEEEMRLAQKEKDSIRSSWDEEMVVAPVEDFDDVEAQEDDPAREEDVDYSSMTVAELKDILRSKGLKVSGKKSELIERLNSS